MMVTAVWNSIEHAGVPACSLFATPVAAGFPSPAESYVERPLDLNEFMVQRPEATFFVRVQGDSMTDANIRSGDILVVDRSLEPRDGQVVVAVLDGEFTVKHLHRRNGRVLLQPANPRFRPIPITPERDFQVWGVVTYVIHAC